MSVPHDSLLDPDRLPERSPSPARGAFSDLRRPWWVRVGADPCSWLIGLPAVAAALLAVAALTPTLSATGRLGGLLRVAPYFLWQSLRGAGACA